MADKYLGAINTFGINSLALGVMGFGWIGVHKRAEMYIYSSVMGFFNGAAQGVFPGAASTLVDDVSKMGTWVGSRSPLILLKLYRHIRFKIFLNPISAMTSLS